MGVGQVGASRRYVFIVLGAVAALSLVGCGALVLLPYHGESASIFKSYQQETRAYGRIVPGVTRASQLAEIGFDAMRSPNVEALSYLGVVERFAPRDSMKFDKLDPAVKSCFEARDRCTAVVFDREAHKNHDGSSLLGLFGFGAAEASSSHTADIVLLIRDGRVAYKTMRGLHGKS